MSYFRNLALYWVFLHVHLINCAITRLFSTMTCLKSGVPYEYLFCWLIANNVKLMSFTTSIQHCEAYVCVHQHSPYQNQHEQMDLAAQVGEIDQVKQVGATQYYFIAVEIELQMLCSH